MRVIVKPLQLDRVEISFRVGVGAIVPLQIVNDTIDFYVRNNIARPLAIYPFLRGNSLARHVIINLSRLPSNNLTVATGTSSGRGVGRCCWLKFSFNPHRLLLNENAKSEFLEVMNDLLPAGGYSELLEFGNVIYSEFAVDVLHADMASLEFQTPRMDSGGVIVRDGLPSTIYLNKSRNRSEAAFCFYDKKRSDREVQRRVRRYPIVRFEARRRFNHNPTTRLMTPSRVSSIMNPFLGLEVYDKGQVCQVFSAACHDQFLRDVAGVGVQQALSLTSHLMTRARRLRMLQRCIVPWWSPASVWAGVDDAVRVLFDILE